MCAQVTPPTRDAARPKAPERSGCARKPSWKGRKQKRRRGSARGARGGKSRDIGNALEGECLIRIRCLFSSWATKTTEKSRVHPAHKRASRARIGMPPLAPRKRGTIAGAGEGREEARRERGREQHRSSSSDRKRKRRPPVSPPRTPRVRSHTETVEEEAEDTITEEDDDSEEQVA